MDGWKTHIIFSDMNLKMISTILILAIFTGCQANRNAEQTQKSNHMENKTPLLIGTYTGKDGQSSKGIYRILQNNEHGTLEADTLVASLDNPTFIAVSPDRKYLYAVSEVGGEGSSVHAFSIEPDLSLKKLNSQPTLGKSACHIATDKDQTMAFVANYSSGVATVYSIMEDGSLSEPVQHFEYEGSGPHPNQDGSHPHQTAISPDDQFAYISDLGMDMIHMYRIDKKEKKLIPLEPAAVRLPPGSGPRHLTFHPQLPYAYVINELGNTVQGFRYDKASGQLTPINLYSTLPEDYEKVSYCADIHFSPDGRFLYGSNRGHNSLVIFEMNPEDGDLELKGFQSVHGDWPRNFYISRDGKFLYVGNQKSGNISAFERDMNDGSLKLIDSSFADTFSPVCIIDFK